MNCFLLAAGSPLPTADAKAGKYFSGAKKVYYEVQGRRGDGGDQPAIFFPGMETGGSFAESRQNPSTKTTGFEIWPWLWGGLKQTLSESRDFWISNGTGLGIGVFFKRETDW